MTSGSRNIRDLPLKALLHQSYRPVVSGGGSAPPPNKDALFNAVVAYLHSKSRPSFDYAGEICQVPGFADTGSSQWEKESLIRTFASLLTTKSNAFSVDGVAQTIKKNPANNTSSTQGIFETRATGAAADDIVTGEKRFHAIVERYVWPGVDAVAGNAHPNAGGTYDQLGAIQYLGSNTNAIDSSDPSQAAFSTSSTLEPR